MLQHRILLIALIYCLSVSFATTAFAEKVVVYGDEAYPPVIYLDQGKIKGILPEIFARLSKDTGDTYELILVPWKRAMQESMHEKGGITNFSLTRERANLYDFSEPIYTDSLQLVVLKGHEFAFKDALDLKGKIVGGNAGASFGEKIDQAITDGVFVMERDPHRLSRMLKLLHGRMDVAIIGNGIESFEALLDSNPELAENKSKFIVLPYPLANDTLHLAFVKSMHMKPVLARFNNALIDFKKTKEYKQIIARQDKSK
jgi:polar amino acid transport system substrate-binding protein